MGQVFLSFAGDGLELARALRVALDRRGIPCFLANDEIERGSDIPTALEDALRTSPVLMPIVTPGYGRSAWTRRERSAYLFLDSPDEVRTILPVVVADLPFAAMPPLLRPLAAETVAGVDGVEALAERLAPTLAQRIDTSRTVSYDAFARRYGLRDLVVVDSAPGLALYDSVGKGAARYFERHVQHNFRVGLACANTIHAMVTNLPEHAVKFHAYPISFHLEPAMTDVLSPYVTLIELWRRNPACTPYAVPWAPFFTSLEERAAAERRADVSELLHQLRSVNMAFYSCGSFGTGSSYDVHVAHIRRYIDADFSLDQLTRLGACGEINLNAYSLAGETVPHPVTELFAMLDLEHIRRLAADASRHMVLAAGGPHKVEPILGALRGRYLNVLVTDRATLDAVMRLDR